MWGLQQGDGTRQPVCRVVCDVFQIYPVPLSEAQFLFRKFVKLSAINW